MNELQVKNLLKENNLKWDIFMDWMMGQTHGIVDGEPDYYEWDVNRFVNGHKCRCDCKHAPVKYNKCECVCHK